MPTSSLTYLLHIFNNFLILSTLNPIQLNLFQAYMGVTDNLNATVRLEARFRKRLPHRMRYSQASAFPRGDSPATRTHYAKNLDNLRIPRAKISLFKTLKRKRRTDPAVLALS